MLLLKHFSKFFEYKLSKTLSISINNTMKTVEIIAKENIRDLKFCKKEVLPTTEERKKRGFDLNRAQSLGNLLKNKVYITFETADEKIYRVHTTIWAVGSDFVCLKSDICIPINCILEIE
ncbi:hypothetical protein B879_02701 [Cecembia lonarensis LW9]|uniref:Uncharacterized protein n=2 Tax=Cecembia TaxID=1187078 RepID=K1LWY1_CECL9|nr:hypothetical protein B879_02701 [Cecembia lonarensis LW9]